jgi:hypothetical protein
MVSDPESNTGTEAREQKAGQHHMQRGVEYRR